MHAMTIILSIGVLILGGFFVSTILLDQGEPAAPSQAKSSLPQVTARADAHEESGRRPAEIASEAFGGPKRGPSAQLQITTSAALSGRQVRVLGLLRRSVQTEDSALSIEELPVAGGGPFEVGVPIQDELLGLLVMAPSHEGVWVDRNELSAKEPILRELALTPWQVHLHHDYAPLVAGRVTTALTVGGLSPIEIEAREASERGGLRVATLKKEAFETLKAHEAEGYLSWSFEAEGFAARSFNDRSELGQLGPLAYEVGLFKASNSANRGVVVTVNASSVPLDYERPIEIVFHSGGNTLSDLVRFELNLGESKVCNLATVERAGFYAVAASEGLALRVTSPTAETCCVRDEILFKAESGFIDLEVMPARGRIDVSVHRPQGFEAAQLRLDIPSFGPEPVLKALARVIDVPKGEGVFAIAIADWAFERANVQAINERVNSDHGPLALDLKRMQSQWGPLPPLAHPLPPHLGTSQPHQPVLPRMSAEGVITIAVAPSLEKRTPVNIWWTTMTRLQFHVRGPDALGTEAGQIAVFDPKIVPIAGKSAIPISHLERQGDGTFGGWLRSETYIFRAFGFSGCSEWESHVHVPDQPLFSLTVDLEPERSIRIEFKAPAGTKLEGAKVSLRRNRGFWLEMPLIAEATISENHEVILAGVVPGPFRVEIQGIGQSLAFAHSYLGSDCSPHVDFHVDARDSYEFAVVPAEELKVRFVSDLGEIPSQGWVNLENLETGSYMRSGINEKGQLTLGLLSKPSALRIVDALFMSPRKAQRPSLGPVVRFIGETVVRTGEDEKTILFTRAPQ